MDTDLTIYSKPGCMKCASLIRYAVRKGIPHRVVDVSQDPAALAHVKALGYQMVPVTELGDQHFGDNRIDLLTKMAATLDHAA